jgi:hypothetical protein
MFQAIFFRENRNTFYVLTFLVRKIMPFGDNMEKHGRDRQHTNDSIIRRMCIACWIAKTTDTHSECEVLIAFSRQHWLRERTALLRVHLRYPFCKVIRPSTRGLPNSLFLTGFPTKNVYALYSFPYVLHVPPFTLDLSVQNALYH